VAGLRFDDAAVLGVYFSGEGAKQLQKGEERAHTYVPTTLSISRLPWHRHRQVLVVDDYYSC
jgi:hypothetical protein